jgi:transcriptional regulator with XRE-family HTH domain
MKVHTSTEREPLQPESRRRRDLGNFLKARRMALKPENFGLSSMGRRRTPGLRREEIAQIAGIGLTWYTWLEQGRDIRVSEETLERLVRLFQLPPHDAAYVYSLAGHKPEQISEPADPVYEQLHALLNACAWPGVVFNGIFDAVVYNSIADSIFHFDEYQGPRAGNQIWRMFMDPGRRRLYADWERCSRFSAGLVRGAYANRKDDLELLRLIDELCDRSTEFRNLWNERGREGASSWAPAGVLFDLPDFGVLSFVLIRLAVPTHPGWFVIFWQPADEDAARALKKMASAGATTTEVA